MVGACSNVCDRDFPPEPELRRIATGGVGEGGIAIGPADRFVGVIALLTGAISLGIVLLVELMDDIDVDDNDEVDNGVLDNDPFPPPNGGRRRGSITGVTGR